MTIMIKEDTPMHEEIKEVKEEEEVDEIGEHSIEDLTNLIKTANESGDKMEVFELWKKLLSMDEWWFIPTGTKEDWTYLVVKVKEDPTIFCFTEKEKAMEFAHGHKVFPENDEPFVLNIQPRAFMNNLPSLREQGLANFVVDDSWEMTTEQLLQMYDYLLCPADMKKLLHTFIEEKSIDSARELWTTVFSRPNWYFIADMSSDQAMIMSSATEEGIVNIHVFLTRYEADKVLSTLQTSETSVQKIEYDEGSEQYGETKEQSGFSNMKVYTSTTDAALDYLDQLNREGNAQAMFHADNTDFGFAIDQLRSLKEGLEL